MPSSRSYCSILPSLNIASVAMPSLATATGIPAPQRASVACLPFATARSIPRPVNSLSVARKHTTTVQRARPSTSLASLASSLAAMSISKPVNQAIASPSATKPTPSLPCRKLASERIQARRQRVIANLTAPKRRTAPASTHQSSSVPSRAVSPAVKPLKSALKRKDSRPRVIPPPTTCAPAVSSRYLDLTTLKPRGNQPYCEGRYCELDPDTGNRPRTDYAPLYSFGIACTCHNAGGREPNQLFIDCREWKTTPAEADVDPSRRRIVRFAENPVRSTKGFPRWYNDTWSNPSASRDQTTEAEDDAAIDAIDNPPPASSDFNSKWQALMDEGFSDDDQYF